MTNKKLSLTVISCLVWTLVLAWNKQGHYITGDIAFKVAPKNIQDSVSKYAGDVKWGALAAWLDDETDCTPHHANSLFGAFLKQNKMGSSTDIPTLINQAINTIKNRTKAEKWEVALSIKILFHLIADLHQPLNSTGDKYDNSEKLCVDFSKKFSTLYAVWNNDIIQERQITTSSLGSLYYSITPTQLASIRKIDINEWKSEAIALLPGAYRFNPPRLAPCPILTTKYTDRNELVIKRQLLYAGFRIAAMLTSLFSK